MSVISDAENKTIMPSCKMSMCPTKSTTEDSIIEDSPLLCGAPLNITIELGAENEYFTVDVDQIVNTDDVIGYIDDIPVKSIANFIVTDKDKKYIIGKYITDEKKLEDMLDIDTLKNKTDENVDAISDILKENANVVAFIKDYILRFRFADLAVHTMAEKTEGWEKSSYPSSTVIKAYEKDADLIINEYNDAIYRICDKDSVKARCEADDLLGIKKDLDNERNLVFGKIISQYNGIDGYGYSRGSVSDYMMYTNYMEYLTSDNFAYDENNPYIVELFNDLSGFIGTRSRIELNATNISALITEFNTLCNDTIKKFWSDSKKDYYSGIKEIFNCDFYANSDDELVEAKINDENRVTLYEKVLKYLKTLTKYVEPQSAEQKYASLDTNSIINSDGTLKTVDEKAKTTEELENEELEKKLKKIALTFTSLLHVERNSKSYDYFSEFVSKDDLNNIFTLKEKKGTNYVDDYVEQDSRAISQSDQTIMKKYLGALKGVTENEARILRELSDRAIKWYNDNASKIDSGEIFESLKQISWPSPSRITVHETEPSDFYFVQKQEDEKDTGTKSAAADSSYDDIENDEDTQKETYTEDSLKTEYGVDSYNYWLKYFTMATLTHCMLPMYWPTGLIIMGTPVPLPVIYIPIYVLSGRVTTVFGLGMCGICPLPLILLINMSELPGFSVTALVNAIDYTKKGLMLLNSIGDIALSTTIEQLLKASDEEINKLREERENVDKEIKKTLENIGTDRETLRNLMKKIGKNSTSRSKKKNRG